MSRPGPLSAAMPPLDEPIPRADDGQLAMRFTNGERAALTELVRRYGAGLIVALDRTAPGHGEVAAQETWFRCCTALSTFDASRPFFPWLLSVGRNAARDIKKHESRLRSRDEAAGETRAAEAAAASPPEEAVRAELRRLRDECLAAAAEPCRTILYLSLVRIRDWPQIAEGLGLTVQETHNRAKGCRARLRACLEEKGWTS